MTILRGVNYYSSWDFCSSNPLGLANILVLDPLNEKGNSCEGSFHVIKVSRPFDEYSQRNLAKKFNFSSGCGIMQIIQNDFREGSYSYNVVQNFSICEKSNEVSGPWNKSIRRN